MTGGVVRAIVVALAAAAVLAAPRDVRAQSRPLGPFGAADHNPLFRLLNTPHADAAEPVEAGTLRFEASVAYSNIFEQSESPDHFQLFDMERMTNRLTVRYGLAPRWEVGGRLGTHTSWGGFLDSFISEFHHVFGLPNGNRDSYPEGQYEFFLVDERREIDLDVPRRSPVLEDVRLFVKRTLAGGADRRTATSAAATLRVASGAQLGTGGRPDLAVSVLHRRSWEGLHLHLQGGVTTLNPPEEVEPLFRSAAGFFSVAVERSLNPSLSLVAQAVGGTPYAGGVGETELDRPPMNLVLGVAGAVTDGWRWTFSFAEDLPANSPSADFTVDLTVSRTVRP